ncbi:MAG: CvpA family protein [Agathobacter sp.]|nr:CvpA family protein [Agathobacter sp.]
MNLVLIAGILILALNIVLGYKEGFVKAAYSLVAWILVLILTTCLTPVATDWVMNHTSIPTGIEAYVYEQIEKGIEEKQQEVGEQLGTQLEIGETQGLKALEQYGIYLPDAVLDKLEEMQEEIKIDESLEAVTDSALSPVYRTLAATITVVVIKGVTSVVIMILAVVLVFVLGAVLDIVSKLPVIDTANKTLGIIAGAIKGILIIWLLLAVLSFFSVTEMGQTLIAWIYENPILIWIYENNPLLNLLFLFI